MFLLFEMWQQAKTDLREFSEVFLQHSLHNPLKTDSVYFFRSFLCWLKMRHEVGDSCLIGEEPFWLSGMTPPKCKHVTEKAQQVYANFLKFCIQ